ncbi:MAG: lysine--tRNA ligase [Candidatus Aenigmatarchaeota archaeon]
MLDEKESLSATEHSSSRCRRTTTTFWADRLAKEAMERAKRENVDVTCRSGASPSGAKHIGNLFDVLKSYIVHKSVLDNGFKSRLVLTHDDRDPIRKIPPRLPDLEGNWHTTEEIAKKMQSHLGEPYCNAPDPFGCCKSWSKHFATVWENGIRALGVEMQTYYNDDLYKQGKFEPFIVRALKNIDTSRKVIMQFQETKNENYIPFDVICENCGKIIGRATGFDLEQKTIDYVCEKKTLAGKYEISGCGHRGTVSFDQGKLPWSFEWPAQWLIFKTTFEPFGKEHAEGSWPRCSAICKNVYNAEPPIPHIYEFLLVNGKKMAARMGNAYVVQDMLRILEPEIFFYFYTKRSTRQRNLDIENIYYLVDEFEKAERITMAKKPLMPRMTRK